MHTTRIVKHENKGFVIVYRQLPTKKLPRFAKFKWDSFVRNPPFERIKTRSRLYCM